jgi:hypothetical protein
MSWNITGAPGKGEDLLYSQAGTPTLDLRFASSKNLIDYVSGQNLITYTRAGDATFFDANGTIQTAGANVARFDHNPATGESLGLLIEEARTNLLLNSETLSTQDVTVTAAAHTLSFYGTGTVTLSGTHSATVVGTGAFPTRTTLTFTPTSGSLTVTVSGTVQYAQVELGGFATSWISTAGATATRNADVASITGTNFSRWYSQSAGSVFVESNSYNPSAINGIVSFNNSTSSNRIDIRQQVGQVRTVVTDGGSEQALLLTGTGNNPAANVYFKVSLAYALNNFGLSLNGLSSITDNSGSVPPVLLMTINALENNSFTRSGHIRRLAYFDRRLPNATLQAITA